MHSMKKNICADPVIQVLITFGPQLGQNCPFGVKETFLGNATSVIFFYICPIVMQNLEKILRADSKI